MNTSSRSLLRPQLQQAVEKLKSDFDRIPEKRKMLLNDLAAFIRRKVSDGEQVNLNFICTHNSRRSHIAQLWAQAAAFYYGIQGVTTFSGGTEATAFNPRAVKAMQEIGFSISQSPDQHPASESNPVYRVTFSEQADGILVFSKKYDHPVNPQREFAAIMTCSHADENCPLIPGALKRFSLTYNDPKDFDGTPQEASAYHDRAMEIGRDIFYAFSKA